MSRSIRRPPSTKPAPGSTRRRFRSRGRSSLAGRSANAGVVVPVIAGHVEGRYLGEPAEVDRFGLGDPRFRVAVNLYGAPSMTPQAVRVVSAADDRRRQPYGRAAARPVRSDEADQPRHQSLVAQAGGRLLPHEWQVGPRGDGRRLALHRQHRLRGRPHAGAGSDCRHAGPRHLQVHPRHVAGGRRQLLHRRNDDDRRQARTSISSATHASAPRFRERSIATRRFGCR